MREMSTSSSFFVRCPSCFGMTEWKSRDPSLSIVVCIDCGHEEPERYHKAWFRVPTNGELLVSDGERC